MKYSRRYNYRVGNNLEGGGVKEGGEAEEYAVALLY